MKLIDVDNLISEIKTLPSQNILEYIGLYDLIKSLPFADAELARHEQWEEIRDAYGNLEGWICKCGRETKSKDKYCPNCGAKMT